MSCVDVKHLNSSAPCMNLPVLDDKTFKFLFVDMNILWVPLQQEHTHAHAHTRTHTHIIIYDFYSIHYLHRGKEGS